MNREAGARPSSTPCGAPGRCRERPTRRGSKGPRRTNTGYATPTSPGHGRRPCTRGRKPTADGKGETPPLQAISSASYPAERDCRVHHRHGHDPGGRAAIPMERDTALGNWSCALANWPGRKRAARPRPCSGRNNGCSTCWRWWRGSRFLTNNSRLLAGADPAWA